VLRSWNICVIREPGHHSRRPRRGLFPPRRCTARPRAPNPWVSSSATTARSAREHGRHGCRHRRRDRDVAHSQIEGAVGSVKEAGKAVQHPLGPHPHPPLFLLLLRLLRSCRRRRRPSPDHASSRRDVSSASTTTTRWRARPRWPVHPPNLPVSGLYLSNLSVRLPRNPSTMDVYMMSHVFPPVAGSRSGLTSLACEVHEPRPRTH
jgi:hypothetical protein